MLASGNSPEKCNWNVCKTWSPTRHGSSPSCSWRIQRSGGLPTKLSIRSFSGTGMTLPKWQARQLLCKQPCTQTSHPFTVSRPPAHKASACCDKSLYTSRVLALSSTTRCEQFLCNKFWYQIGYNNRLCVHAGYAHKCNKMLQSLRGNTVCISSIIALQCVYPLWNDWRGRATNVGEAKETWVENACV